MRALTMFTLAAFAGLGLARRTLAADESAAANTAAAPAETRARWDDSRRFYFLFQTGLVLPFDDEFAGDTHLESHELPGTNHVNVPIGVGLGYNLSNHWGLELQGIGTEPDVRSDRSGKLVEYSNITVFGAVRYRHPIGDGRWVPWASGGIGWSINAINDETNPRFKLDGDGSTIAGMLAAGVDYLLNEDVAIGGSAQAMIYPDISTDVINKDTGEHQRGNVNLTGMALLIHLRVFPGRTPAIDGSDIESVKPYDSDERRWYLFGDAGDQIFFDDNYGGGVKAKSAGSANWTLGGGGGVNLDEHWGVELGLLSNSDLNIMDGVLGKIGEMGIFTVLPTARFRWQFLDGRLVPYAIAGLGFAVTRPNDPRNVVDVYLQGSRRTPKYDIQNVSAAGQVGVGLEYFLNRHVSIGLGLPFILYPDWDTTVQQRDKNGQPVGEPVKSTWNYTGIFPNVRFTAYLN